MNELIDKLPAILAITFLFGGWVIYAVVNSVASNSRRARVAEQHAVLKKEMLDKGFSADDIVRVLEAGRDRKAGEPADVTTAMIDGGYDVKDLTAVAAALDRVPADSRDEVRRAVLKLVEEEYSGADVVKFIDARAAARSESAVTA